jgi:hypothetical protein
MSAIKASAPDRRGPAHRACGQFLDVTAVVRVAGAASRVDLGEAHDREDQRGDPDAERQQPSDESPEPEGHGGEDGVDDEHRHLGDADGDLEVQGFLRLDVRAGAAVLEDEPDDERRKDPDDAAEVGERCPLLVFRLGERGGRLRLRLGGLRGIGHGGGAFLSIEQTRGSRLKVSPAAQRGNPHVRQPARPLPGR